jgi:8-oxo-dGTP pyrophosphatase MutT (NUDIX family)
LLLQRSDAGDAAGQWAFPGGKIEEGESAAKAALRETLEETGFRAGSAGTELCTRVEGDVHYTTFLVTGVEEFVPTLNEEHTNWAWVKPGEALASYGAMGMAPGPSLPAISPGV